MTTIEDISIPASLQMRRHSPAMSGGRERTPRGELALHAARSEPTKATESRPFHRMRPRA
jgi:hypothetical protein